MPTAWTALTLLCAALLLPGGLHALKCYECSATGDDKCSDPLNFVTAMTMNTCETSVGYCMKMKSGNIVTRGCALLCASVNSEDNGMFCCQTDKCNAGTRVSQDLALLLLLPVSALLIAVRHHF